MTGQSIVKPRVPTATCPLAAFHHLWRPGLISEPMSLNIKQNIKDGFKRADPMRYFIAKLLVKTRLCDFFIIDRGDYRLRFFPSNVAVEMFIEGSSYLRHDEEILRNLLNQGDTYVDVGANVGHLLFTAKNAVGPGGIAIGIEPHPRIFGYLVANTKLNHADVRLSNVAIGSRLGKVSFSDSRSDDMNSVLTNGGNIVVEIQTLDELLKDIQRIDLLKIDVEGYELEALKGAACVLERTRLVYFESYMKHAEKFGYETRDLINLLVGKGFSVLKFTERGWRQVGVNHVSKDCENLLAARSVESLGLDDGRTPEGRAHDGRRGEWRSSFSEMDPFSGKLSIFYRSMTGGSVK